MLIAWRFESREVHSYRNNFDALVTDIKKWKKDKYSSPVRIAIIGRCEEEWSIISWTMTSYVIT